MEIQKTNQKGKLEYWKKQIQACHSSGLSKKKWCETNQIKPNTYYRWQKLVWEAEIKNDPLNSIGTKEIIFEEYHPQIVDRNTPAITVRFGEISLEIQNGADPQSIEAAIHAIEMRQSPC